MIADHSAGHVRINGAPIKLADAVWLHEQLGLDARVARASRDWLESNRLTLMRYPLEQAIRDCADWRRAAGYSDPVRADR